MVLHLSECACANISNTHLALNTLLLVRAFRYSLPYEEEGDCFLVASHLAYDNQRKSVLDRFLETSRMEAAHLDTAGLTTPASRCFLSSNASSSWAVFPDQLKADLNSFASSVMPVACSAKFILPRRPFHIDL